MALHFSCNQYQQAFDPKRLQNWNVPHKYRKHPVAYDGFTKVIANDRGHLLPAVPRSTRSPWGTFVGTWDLPKRIPGNKLRDPMARSAEQHYRNLELHSTAREVIQGRLKVRRAQAGTREDLEETLEDARSGIRSSRSGAANPLAKAVPDQKECCSDSNLVEVSIQQPLKPPSCGKSAKPQSPVYTTMPENIKATTPHPQSPAGRQASRLSKEPMSTPAPHGLSLEHEVSHSPKPLTPLASGEPRLYSPQVYGGKAFSPIL